MSYNIFERWPFTSFENLNLDWLLNNVKTTEQDIKKINQFLKTLNVQEAVNNKIDELLAAGELGAILQPFGFGGWVSYHTYSNVGDTSWVIIAMPREYYELSFHNCSGNDQDTPTTRTSNPRDFLASDAGAQYMLAHNCNFGGKNWGARWNGINYPRTVTDIRNFFAYNSTTGDCAYYDGNTSLPSIPAEYDVIFACGDPIILNNNPTGIFILDGGLNPRTAFGWDDDYYYIFSCEGRGTMERGLELSEVQSIMIAHGIRNAVNFDGGGSVCLAGRTAGGVQKFNTFRDGSIAYNMLRSVGLAACYKRKEVSANYE